MIRVVLAVVLAAALVAASMPAISEARADRTATTLDRAGERLRRASESLLATDAAAGARRVVTVRLPTATVSAAGVDRVAVACTPDCALRYRLSTGATGHHSLGSLPLSTPDGPVTVSQPGVHHLALGLDRRAGERVVTVRG